ncbi:DUF4382 domain-containing protein [Pseudoduganella eburnea]|uniref:DUF4382 domain-containing protein n=1 Tax=Massilia eburnea TaxID=1776165 RepID=A0A6L6QIY8_9BURK|nr:DUF4382 domain-containing protein [Massilia eburnea]MTW12151.1 DUF4382 domain-containing protein [Massilia eburnea]
MNPKVSLLPLFLASALLAACGGGGGGSSSQPTQTMGTLAVSMTDAPACGFDAVNVTVNKVRVNTSATASDTDGGWTDITLSPAKKINLLNLTNGTLDALGQTSLAAGHYNQVRLVLDANTGNATNNSVVLSGTTTEISLDTPSAVQSGIKMNADFTVEAGQRYDLVMDFDACKSIVTKGNGKYALKPVVKVIPTALNGISGFVSLPLLTDGVVVSAQQNGAVIASTTPSSTGEFDLTRLPLGNYDVVITSNTHAAYVVGGVPVTSLTGMVPISTTAAPFTLASTSLMGSISGTATLTPASATESALVSAKQAISGGPTVTLRYTNADMVSGAYSITKLPLSAPQYAAYSATLPLSFGAALTTPTTGMYKVEASATGYTTLAIPTVDITAADQTNVNFSLIP